MNKLSRKVLIIQRRLTDYRIPFFQSLKKQLADRDCELILAYGDGTEEEKAKHDSGYISWGRHLKTRYAFSGRICWQPFGSEAQNVQMIVVALENKLLYNLLYQYFVPGIKFGLWGHGANLQGNPGNCKERYKHVLARHADWWFGYTNLSLPLILNTGFPQERVSILNNSIDTKELSMMRSAVTLESLTALRAEFGINGNQVGVFVGSLYKEKRIEFMFEAARLVRDRIPDFELLIIGSGELQGLVDKFCALNKWAHYLGVRKGQDKVNAMVLAKIMINPGLVGLGILDSFVCRVPVLTTDCGLHSPEISYLENGINGLMTENSLDAYVNAVCTLLNDSTQLNRLIDGCNRSSTRYTIENMANQFAVGVDRCLAAPVYRGHG